VPGSPFDPARAGFWLVAFVVGGFEFAVVGSVVMCWINADAIVAGKFQCDANDKLVEAFAIIMSNVFSYAVGRLSIPPSPKP
jgi:hypothetical protein